MCSNCGHPEACHAAPGSVRGSRPGTAESHMSIPVVDGFDYLSGTATRRIFRWRRFTCEYVPAVPEDRPVSAPGLGRKGTRNRRRAAEAQKVFPVHWYELDKKRVRSQEEWFAIEPLRPWTHSDVVGNLRNAHLAKELERKRREKEEERRRLEEEERIRQQKKAQKTLSMVGGPGGANRRSFAAGKAPNFGDFGTGSKPLGTGSKPLGREGGGGSSGTGAGGSATESEGGKGAVVPKVGGLPPKEGGSGTEDDGTGTKSGGEDAAGEMDDDALEQMLASVYGADVSGPIVMGDEDDEALNAAAEAALSKPLGDE